MFTSAAEFSGSFNMGIGEYNGELWLQQHTTRGQVVAFVSMKNSR